MRQNGLERATGSTLMRRLPRWESFWVLESLRVAESLLALECLRPSDRLRWRVGFGPERRCGPGLRRLKGLLGLFLVDVRPTSFVIA